MSSESCEYQKEVGLFILKLCKFLAEENPNPFVAIAGLEIAKHQFLTVIGNTKAGGIP